MHSVSRAKWPVYRIFGIRAIFARMCPNVCPNVFGLSGKDTVDRIYGIRAKFCPTLSVSLVTYVCVGSTSC
jgi:hypothetical protein